MSQKRYKIYSRSTSPPVGTVNESQRLTLASFAQLLIFCVLPHLWADLSLKVFAWFSAALGHVPLPLCAMVMLSRTTDIRLSLFIALAWEASDRATKSGGTEHGERGSFRWK